MARDFGIPSFDGYPIDAVKPLLRAAITEAMQDYVPEVRIESITFEQDEMTGTLSPMLEVEV